MSLFLSLFCSPVYRLFRSFWYQPDCCHFHSTGDAALSAVIVYPSWGHTPFFTCFFQCHIIHTAYLHRLHYNSFARRIQVYHYYIRKILLKQKLAAIQNTLEVITDRPVKLNILPMLRKKLFAVFTTGSVLLKDRPSIDILYRRRRGFLL